MDPDFPTHSISESSMAGWRGRFPYVPGDSLCQDAREQLGEGGLLGLMTRGEEDNGEQGGPGGAILARNLAWSVPGVKQVHDHLGSGTYGHVWDCEVDGLPKRVALKVFKPGRRFDRQMRECRVHSELHHPNLVQLLQVIDGPPAAIATELCSGGTLAQFIHDPARRHSAPYPEIPMQVRLQAALDVVSCLEYLHKNNVLHRDVKPSNCLLSSVYEAGAASLPAVKLADFGLARQEADEMSQMVGTLVYMAPELMEGDDYSFPVDVYSTAMLLYELATGIKPYSTSRERLRNDVAFVLAVSQGERPAFDGGDFEAVGEDIRNVIQASWSDDPAGRPTAEALAEVLRGLIGTTA